MPSHSKPVITDSDTVSVSINPQTLITIFGVNLSILFFTADVAHHNVLSCQVATSTCNQKVQAELKDADSNVQSTAVLDGMQKESLYLEDNSTKKTIVWGPFDAQMTVELAFSHQNPDTDDWDPSSIKADKMKEANDIFLVDVLN